MLISILILNHNRVEFLDRAIRSCLNQIRVQNDIEIIVVDDASTDDSVKKLHEYSDEIKVIQNLENLGVGHSSNIGLMGSKGEYFMRVDADDFISPFAVTILEMTLTNNPDSGFAFSDHFLVDSIGLKIKKVKVDSFNKLLNFGAGILFRSSILKEIGGYNSDLRHCEDMEVLFRLREKGIKGTHVPIPLYRYYMHGNNLSKSSEQLRKAEELINKYGI